MSGMSINDLLVSATIKEILKNKSIIFVDSKNERLVVSKRPKGE